MSYIEDNQVDCIYAQDLEKERQERAEYEKEAWENITEEDQ